MLYSLACKGEAPAALSKVNDQGVPVRAILVTLAVLLLAVLLNYLVPAKVFGMMMSILSFNTVWTWTMVLLAHYSFRRQLRAKGEAPAGFRLRWWPFTGIVCLAFLGFVVVMLGVSPDTRVALYVGAAWIALLSVAYKFCGVKHRMVLTDQRATEAVY
jgi:L-asparagine transporter-like permease